VLDRGREASKWVKVHIIRETHGTQEDRIELRKHKKTFKALKRKSTTNQAWLLELDIECDYSDIAIKNAGRKMGNEQTD